MKRGKLLVISGPSGCGKSTVSGKRMAERGNVITFSFPESALRK